MKDMMCIYYAVPSIRCANREGFTSTFTYPPHIVFSFPGVIELDGGTFSDMKKIGKRTYVALSGHNSPEGLRNWREKNNAAMSQGWRVWHYAPEEVIKAGRKTLLDEPILKKLAWM